MKRILYSILTVELLVVAAVWAHDVPEAAADDASASASAESFQSETPSPALAAVYPQGHVLEDPFAEAVGPTPDRHSENVVQAPRAETVYRSQVVTVLEPVVESSAESALRQQYLGVMRRHAQRMSEVELKSTIESLETEMNAQDEAADAEVQKAIAILEAVVEQSQGTPAAVRSRLAIDVLKNKLPQPAGDIQLN